MHVCSSLYKDRLNNGCFVDCENVSDDGVLCLGFSVTGIFGPITRILCAVQPRTQKVRWTFDWRAYFEVFHATVEQLPEASTHGNETELRFTHPVPLMPGERRWFYVYTGPIFGSDERAYLNYGFQFKRPRSVRVTDGTLCVHRSLSNFGAPFEIMQRSTGVLFKLTMLTNTMLAGDVLYRHASPAELDAARAVTHGLLFSRADFCDAADEGVGIGDTNRYLIDEWNGVCREDPRERLCLPGEQLGGGWRLSVRRRSSSAGGSAGGAGGGSGGSGSGSSLPSPSSIEPGWHASRDELTVLWERSAACRELWRRFLDRSGRGRGEAWLAELRAGVGSVLACRLPSTAVTVLEGLIGTYPPLPERLQRWQRLKISVRRQLLRRARTALERVAAEARATLRAGGSTPMPVAKLEALRTMTEAYLLTRLRPFRASPEFWACTRLWAASPRAVSLRNFTLIRRFGKGSCAP